MLRGDRGKLSKARLIVGGVVAAIIMAGALLGWGLTKATEYERQAYNQAREYATDTNHEIGQSCLSLAGAKKHKCITDARHEQRANERNEYDLVAQRQSALWAYVMGAAAVIGMGLSVVGVVLVWTTFAETRRANEISEREQRPWLTYKINEVSPFVWEDGGLRVKIEIEVENVGKLPAVGLRIESAAVGGTPDHESITNKFKEYAERFNSRGWGQWLLPGQKTVARINTKVMKNEIVYVDMHGQKAYSPLVGICLTYGAIAIPGTFQTAAIYILGEAEAETGNFFMLMDGEDTPTRRHHVMQHPGGDRLT